MKQNYGVALTSGLFLVPALLLICSGLLHLEPPAGVTAPVFVVGGLLLAFAANAAISIQLGLSHGQRLMPALRHRPDSAINLLFMATAAILLLVIAAYVIIENVATG